MLGALTRGDRRAASGVDLSEYNFDSPLGRKSLRCVLAPGDEAFSLEMLCGDESLAAGRSGLWAILLRDLCITALTASWTGAQAAAYHIIFNSV